MAGASYNGWSGIIRDVRGTLFYKEVHKTKPTSCCKLCGDLQKFTSLSHHAEEYGSTWKEYLENCHLLCARCHGMIHVRFRFPNLWARYVHKVRQADFGGCKRFKTLIEFFAYAKKCKDIPPYPWIDTDLKWLDSMPRKAYVGPPKLALIDRNEVLVPDPKIYPAGWGTMTGMVLYNQKLEIMTFNE